MLHKGRQKDQFYCNIHCNQEQRYKVKEPTKLIKNSPTFYGRVSFFYALTVILISRNVIPHQFIEFY